MGVDRGIHVIPNKTKLSHSELPPLTIAKIYEKIIEKENPHIILFGIQVKNKLIKSE
jgi:electron transfer flavoprotein alpha/beta subunit